MKEDSLEDKNLEFMEEENKLLKYELKKELKNELENELKNELRNELKKTETAKGLAVYK
jgi:hypothetical protein